MRPQDWERLPWPVRQRLQREALLRYRVYQENDETAERAERRRQSKRAAERRYKAKRKSELVTRCTGCGGWTWQDQACTTCAALAETRHLPSACEAQRPDEAHRPAEAEERQDSQDVPHPAGATRR